MEAVEHRHERLHEPLTESLLRRRARQGWRAVAVVWERTAEAGARAEATLEAVPYGLRVARDGSHLEPAPEEVRALLLLLDGLVRERSYAQIAHELNQAGCRTRRGEPWNQTAVFRLLPRLIELAPSLHALPDPPDGSRAAAR